MALSTKRINLIIGDAKAGRHGTVTQLCKHHKVSTKTYYGMQKKYNFKWQENASIVEAGVVLEKIKGSKKVAEKTAIEKAIKEKITISAMDDDIIFKNRELALVIQKAIKKNKKSIDLSNIKQVSSTLRDLENIANPTPKESKEGGEQTKKKRVNIVRRGS